jgi:D-arabinose 1-dehydrogenase-like Zn-dependent alcohol dehydrogenase
MNVGIIGIGGLGHFGILWAKALGAEKVVAISRRSNKRQDAVLLGADEYVATEEDVDWAKSHAMTLDLLISTVSSSQVWYTHSASNIIPAPLLANAR